jgi:superfamily II DNA or RNA helicase
LLTKYYLLLNPTYKTELSDVWFLNEVPEKVRNDLNLPDSDQGIDLIARTKTGGYWAIQCKYRSGKNRGLTWREISTFTGLAFGICKNIEFGLVAYSGERYAKVIGQSKHIGFLSADIWSTLDEAFFAELASKLKGEAFEVRPRKPRPHQRQAIDKAIAYFGDASNSRGKLIMPCGTGKSLTAYWIAEALNANLVVVAVPSLSLIAQTIPVWLREYTAQKKDGDLRWLCVCSDQSVTEGEADAPISRTQDLGVPCLTDEDEIASWLLKTTDTRKRVIFSTYQSGRVLAAAVRKVGITVELGIMDEAHKTVGQKGKVFSHLLFDENLPMTRRIFMTATERRYAGRGNDIISMDDPAVYGEAFDLLSFKEALDEKPPILSDYKIITMIISEREVANLVKQNRFIRLVGRSEEAEAQMFAAMIALRKAMRKYRISHAVSFHSSIARAADFARFNEFYHEMNLKSEPIEAYHVTGATPSAVRKGVINAFVKSDKALITNARCLTEGVDVPNIDCVLFVDPRHSTIDIVQAVGRALRPHKGKSFGYVLVPVISNTTDADVFGETPAFASVIRVLRALSSNDERIVEYFRAIHSGRRLKGRTIEIDIDEKVALDVNVQQFIGKVQTKVWDKLARLSWRSYEEAKRFAQNLKLRGQHDWVQYCKGYYPNLEAKPSDVPANPAEVYKDAFEGWGIWVGTGRVKQVWRPYAEAAAFVRKLNLESVEEWNLYAKGRIKGSSMKPADIPTYPWQIYKQEFKRNGGYGGWLGTNFVATNNRAYRRYEDAIKFVHSLKLKSQTEWIEYCEGSRPDLPAKPNDIPRNASAIYDATFQINGGVGGWLGTGRTANKNRTYRSYSEAASFVRALNLKNFNEWFEYTRGDRLDLPNRPSDIPASPNKIYQKEFEAQGGWGAWLGTGNFLTREWREFAQAKNFVAGLKLKGQKEWRIYIKGGYSELSKLPSDIPRTPDEVYGRLGKWKSWPDWLSSGTEGRNELQKGVGVSGSGTINGRGLTAQS